MISNIEIVLTRTSTLTTKIIMTLRSNLNTNLNLISYSGLILLPLTIEDVATLNTKLKTVRLKDLQTHIGNYTIVSNLLPTDLLGKPICAQIPILHKFQKFLLL